MFLGLVRNASNAVFLLAGWTENDRNPSQTRPRLSSFSLVVTTGPGDGYRNKKREQFSGQLTVIGPNQRDLKNEFYFEASCGRCFRVGSCRLQRICCRYDQDRRCGPDDRCQRHFW
ncbi:hypothetical protein AGR7C_pAt0107 [Agrobacterium deltaense Zutra 3/1]|uniref:Uncharacterized protein n=1 Tax=Agrobacterium deltaense Zutra 3/1 TaxID=1183427 RepID=A0A1S7S378_9HYPH|nr:hypothetical protein AGR7C_pAt0107 [Agrobacterium deltaense Zutra 3/1]